MSKSHRHGRMALMQTLGALVLVTWTTAAHVGAQETASPAKQADTLTPVLYGQVQQVRRDLALRSEELGMLNADEASAERVLTLVRDWVVANQKELAAARRAVLDQKRQLREAMRRVRVGPRDESLLTQVRRLQAQLEQTRQAQRDLVAQLIPQVSTHLSGEQPARWQTLRANRGLPHRYQAAPNVTADQGERLRRTAREEDAAQRDTAEASVLYGSQRSVLEQVRREQAAAMAGVLRAEARVLPVPEALRVPEMTAEEKAAAEALRQ